jgi:hypothetical protein
MGEQLSPTGTVMSPRSMPSRPRTLPAAVLLESTTLPQHWSEVGGVTGMAVGMATARVYTRVSLGMTQTLDHERHTRSTEVTRTESLENMFV